MLHSFKESYTYLKNSIEATQQSFVRVEHSLQKFGIFVKEICLLQWSVGVLQKSSLQNMQSSSEIVESSSHQCQQNAYVRRVHVQCGFMGGNARMYI